MIGKTKIFSMGALIAFALPIDAAKPVKKSSTQKYYKEIKSIKEHDRVCDGSYPSVIVYNSSACSACTLMEPGLNECAKTYPKAKFYVVNAEDPAIKKELHEKVKLKGYPTTYFRKTGQEPRVERGSIPADELDEIVYHFMTGKRKPYKNSKPSSDKPEEIKKSLQEEQE